MARKPRRPGPGVVFKSKAERAAEIQANAVAQELGPVSAQARVLNQTMLMVVQAVRECCLELAMNRAVLPHKRVRFAELSSNLHGLLSPGEPVGSGQEEVRVPSTTVNNAIRPQGDGWVYSRIEPNRGPGLPWLHVWTRPMFHSQGQTVGAHGEDDAGQTTITGVWGGRPAPKRKRRKAAPVDGGPPVDGTGRNPEGDSQPA